jgi:hypothetical protein
VEGWGDVNTVNLETRLAKKEIVASLEDVLCVLVHCQIIVAHQQIE